MDTQTPPRLLATPTRRRRVMPHRPAMTNIDIDSAIDYRSHLTKKRLIYKHINNMRCIAGVPQKKEPNKKDQLLDTEKCEKSVRKIENQANSTVRSPVSCAAPAAVAVAVAIGFNGRCSSVLGTLCKCLASCSVGADFRPCVTVANGHEGQRTEDDGNWHVASGRWPESRRAIKVTMLDTQKKRKQQQHEGC